MICMLHIVSIIIAGMVYKTVYREQDNSRIFSQAPLVQLHPIGPQDPNVPLYLCFTEYVRTKGLCQERCHSHLHGSHGVSSL